MNISSTLNCKTIMEYRENNNLPVYNFGLGENKIPQPKIFIDNLKNYCNKKQYVSGDGIPELQEQIIKTYSGKNYKISNILTGGGLKELLFILQLCFEGKIFHITPSWVSYSEQIKLLKKEEDLIQIITNINDSFKILPKKLDSILSKFENDKKILILNNPCNPTGILYTPKEIFNLSKILKKHNCIVIADEIYQNINHFNEIISISEYLPELTIRGSSVSKDLACGGYRLGWITFPSELNNLYLKCKSAISSIYSCTSVPIQYALAETLKNKSEINNYFLFLNTIYKKVINIVCNLIDKTKIKYVKPNGSWYIFLNFDNYKNKLKNINIKKSTELCNHLIEKYGIISVAGEKFNTPGLNLRFSLIDINLNELENEDKMYSNIIEGINELINFLNKL